MIWLYGCRFLTLRGFEDLCWRRPSSLGLLNYNLPCFAGSTGSTGSTGSSVLQNRRRTSITLDPRWSSQNSRISRVDRFCSQDLRCTFPNFPVNEGNQGAARLSYCTDLYRLISLCRCYGHSFWSAGGTAGAIPSANWCVGSLVFARLWQQSWHRCSQTARVSCNFYANPYLIFPDHSSKPSGIAFKNGHCHNMKTRHIQKRWRR